MKTWTIYLSGEIHTDWRQKIIAGCKAKTLPIDFTFANIDHDSSDAAGDILGEEDNNFWRDHKSAKVNSIVRKSLLRECDLAIVCFGEHYKQWNAAFDAGHCAATGTPYITLHHDAISHPLKEVDADAMAWAEAPEQIIELLRYITQHNV
jgi:YtoQ family protein